MADKFVEPTAAELKSLNADVEAFMKLGTHEEKCSFFHEHPALARVFRALHFPKPAAKAQPPATLTKT